MLYNLQNARSKVILDSAFRAHAVSGPGLFEHVYEVIAAYELGTLGFSGLGSLAEKPPNPIGAPPSAMLRSLHLAV